MNDFRGASSCHSRIMKTAADLNISCRFHKAKGGLNSAIAYASSYDTWVQTFKNINYHITHNLLTKLLKGSPPVPWSRGIRFRRSGTRRRTWGSISIQSLQFAQAGGLTSSTPEKGSYRSARRDARGDGVLRGEAPAAAAVRGMSEEAFAQESKSESRKKNSPKTSERGY